MLIFYLQVYALKLNSIRNDERFPHHQNGLEIHENPVCYNVEIIHCIIKILFYSVVINIQYIHIIDKHTQEPINRSP